MPVISKQSNVTKPLTKNQTKQVNDKVSILDRISPVKKSNLGRIKFSTYGLPKSGKTRFACSFPKPLLVIGAEDGTASVVGIEGIEFVPLIRGRCCEELQELINGPIRDGRWASVVLDTGTKMRDMRLLEILGVDEMPTKKPWGGNAMQTIWGPLASDLRKVWGDLLDLPNRMDLNVIMIAQEQEFTGDEGGVISDIIKPAVGSALGKSLCMFVNAECDYIGQTFIREEETTSEKVIQGKKVKTTQKTGKKEYCMRVGAHETYITGFRHRPGITLPDVIVDPDYDKVRELIEGD
jgi:hypothetical protein